MLDYYTNVIYYMSLYNFVVDVEIFLGICYFISVVILLSFSTGGLKLMNVLELQLQLYNNEKVKLRNLLVIIIL